MPGNASGERERERDRDRDREVTSGKTWLLSKLRGGVVKIASGYILQWAEVLRRFRFQPYVRY